MLLGLEEGQCSEHWRVSLGEVIRILDGNALWEYGEQKVEPSINFPTWLYPALPQVKPMRATQIHSTERHPMSNSNIFCEVSDGFLCAQLCHHQIYLLISNFILLNHFFLFNGSVQNFQYYLELKWEECTLLPYICSLKKFYYKKLPQI